MNKDFFERQHKVGGNNAEHQNQFNRSQREEEFSSKKVTDGITKFVVSLTEIIVAVFKAILIVGGIFSLNAADVLMGTIALTILFGGSDRVAFGIPVVWIAGALSMSASAVQIYFWKVLEKKHISFRDIFNWKKLPNDIRTFLGLALAVAIIDTFIDVSPIPLLVADSPYKAIPTLFNFMVGALVLLAVLVCGFAEKFTSGIGDMLSDTKPVQEKKNISYKPASKNTQPNVKNNIPFRTGSQDLKTFMRSRSEVNMAKLKDD